MNGAGIFQLQANGQLIEITEQPYESEDLLQKWLAQCPGLLAGDQMDSDAPRQWLLVSRESALPSEEGGAGRWSVDHLFLDQDAIPTLVEVKRSSDARLTGSRREVVGQMLDYAANAVVYWPIETLRSQFEKTCARQNRQPEQVLAEFLGVDTDPDKFWEQARTNLQAGKIRLVFVSDKIPPELQRIVEFLNGQMKTAQVLAVEIRQYQGQGLTTLVPRLVGHTITSEDPPTSKVWNWDLFVRELKARCGDEEVAVATKIHEWAKSKATRIWWGRGKRDGSFFPMLDHQGENQWSISVWTYGRLDIQFGNMRTKPPFQDEAKRRELLDRLNQIPGVALPDDAIERYPSIRLSLLKEPTALQQLLETLDWIVLQVRAV